MAGSSSQKRTSNGKKKDPTHHRSSKVTGSSSQGKKARSPSPEYQSSLPSPRKSKRTKERAEAKANLQALQTEYAAQQAARERIEREREANERRIAHIKRDMEAEKAPGFKGKRTLWVPILTPAHDEKDKLKRDADKVQAELKRLERDMRQINTSGFTIHEDSDTEDNRRGGGRHNSIIPYVADPSVANRGRNWEEGEVPDFLPIHR